MNTRYILVLLVLLLLYPVCGEEQSSNGSSSVTISSPDEMTPALEKISGEIVEAFAQLREENRISAENLSITGISGDKATEILSSKLKKITYSHSSLVISPDNRVTAAAPSAYSTLIGTDLSYQNETIFASSKKSPVVSSIFYLKEGFYGISVSYPVFSGHEYLGYTDVTILPDEFLRPLINPFTEQTGYEVFILEPNGMTVYETNEVEIGKNVLTDPLYDTPEIRNVSHAVIEKPEGTIEYTFWNQFWNKQVERQAVWKTLHLDNQEWRIGVVRDISNESYESSGTSDEKSRDLNASISELTTFVEGAADYARLAGQENACASFNNLSGPYVKDDQYIFGYDMNGTTLALPYQQGILGKKRMDLTDTNGFSILPALIDAAKRGGDYLYFVYPNPDSKYQYQLKLAYMKPVDEEWFIGSGIYLSRVNAELDPDEINDLVNRVKEAAGHADKVGKEQAISDFNDMNQSYAAGEAYIFAYDYNGTTLSLPYQPEVIGKNRMNFTDMYGAHITNQEVDTAKRGGGFVYVVYYNPDSGNNELKLCYVLPAGENWLVGSGIYTGTNLD